MTTPSNPAPDSERQTSTSRVFSAPRDEVFEAFVDPARLARWWGPQGFTNTFEEFQFRRGGSWRFVMHGPDGTSYPNAAEFAEIVRPERLVIRHTSAPPFELRLLLEETPEGTRLSWTQTFEAPETFAKLKVLVAEANEQNLDRLGTELRRRA